MILRFDRGLMRDDRLAKAAGSAVDGGSSMMRLLRVYARSAWREAISGDLPPLVERHLAELVSAVCTTSYAEADRRGGPAMGAARLAAMREVLLRHYANPCLAMRDVAAAVGLSERAGHLTFEAAGLTFTEALQAIRLERACERLQVGGERIIDIAYGVGFSDTSHFHRLFKRRYGETPGDMRARARSG